MSFKNIKKAPLLLSLSITVMSGAAFTPRSYAAQLNFGSSSEMVEGADFAVPYDPTLSESDLIESASQDSSIAGFSCDLSPEGSEKEIQPDVEVLSNLGPNLVAQAGTFDVAQFSMPDAGQGAIIGEMCELEGANIGGPGGSGFNPLYATPLLLGFLGLIGSAPEPAATPFIFALLGVGGVFARKRLNSDDLSDED